MSFVSAIGDSLQETLSYLTSIKSPGWGLLSLPNELIGNIIELAVLTGLDEFGWDAMYMSHVCRRFREVALHSSVIWTDLACHCHGHRLARLYAERSNGAGLNIRLNEDWENMDNPRNPYNPGACGRFLEAIIPYHSEWRSLAYSGNHSSRHKLPRHLELPRLEHLRVDGDLKYNFEQYIMPTLKTAYFLNSIPRWSFSSTITSFLLVFRRNSPITLEKWVTLMSFLKATPSITEVGLVLDCNVNSVDFSGVPSATLDNVAVIKLDFTYRNHDCALHLLANAIQMPNLSAMDLCVDFMNKPGPTLPMESRVFDLLPDPTTHTKLKSLRLTVTFDDYQWSHQPSTIKDFDPGLVFDINRAPFLTSLTLRTNFKFRLSSTEARVFPLRRLELEECPRITKEFMEDLYLGLMRDNHWEEFKNIVACDCPNISASMEDGSLNSLIAEKLRIVPTSDRTCMALSDFELDRDFWEVPRN